MNANEYDEIIAHHYSIYRPPLHDLILKKCLPSEKLFALGLDIGCGTGYSTIALKKHCNKVIGIEPSYDMLSLANRHPKISYLQGALIDISFGNHVFDIVTFAGSLYYAKSQSLLNKLFTITKPGTEIITYDFNIDLSEILHSLHHEMVIHEKEMYNHQEDFSGLQADGLIKLTSMQERTILTINLENLTHLLLSSKNNYAVLASKYGSGNLESTIQDALEKLFVSPSININATLYWNTYKVRSSIQE